MVEIGDAVVVLITWVIVALIRAAVTSEGMDRIVVLETVTIAEVAAVAVVHSTLVDLTANLNNSNNMAQAIPVVVEIPLSEVAAMVSIMAAASRMRVLLMVQRTLRQPAHRLVRERRIDGL